MRCDGRASGVAGFPHERLDRNFSQERNAEAIGFPASPAGPENVVALAQHFRQARLNLFNLLWLLRQNTDRGMFR